MNLHKNTDAVRDRLIRDHMHLVSITANKVKAHPNLVGWERGDSLSMGYQGLMRAAQDYDPTRGGKFSSYAIHWIRGAILEGCRRYRCGTRHTIPLTPRSLSSLVTSDTGEEALTLGDVLPDPAPPLFEDAARREEGRFIREAIDRLPERERLVIALRHRDDPLFYREIGVVLGVGECRAYQLHQQALKRLRGYLHRHFQEDAPCP